MAVGQVRETLDDLMKHEGKAELIGGRIVALMATGSRPNQIAARIFRSLDDFAKTNGRGHAYTDNIGYAIPELSSGRESFSPDASFFTGSLPDDEMDFLEGPPIFAVEVRSKSDYVAGAEAEMAAKRADYFEAGTKVVWDVDPKAETIAVYLPTMDEPARAFRLGQIADAEPWLPGWTIAVNEVFQE